MKVITKVSDLECLLNEHFSSFNCTRYDATRQSIKAFIPRLAQFTEIEINSFFVYHSNAINKACVTIRYHSSLFDVYIDVSSVMMTPMALFRFLSDISSKHLIKTLFYHV